MSAGLLSSLTILFEAPFWIGLYERTDHIRYEVCKITFGSEPKDYEVYEFLSKNWHKLKFSPPIQAEVAIERKVNPKRMQREIQCLLCIRFLYFSPPGPYFSNWQRFRFPLWFLIRSLG